MINSIETIANYETIGLVKLDDMNTLPYLSVYYKGNELDRLPHSETCDGSCFDFVNKYFKI